MATAAPVFSVRGPRQLALESSDWNAARFVEWVAAGFECLSDPARESEWSIAFAPLVFRSDSSVIGQLAAALSESRRAGYAWPGGLRQAILEHLNAMALTDRRTLAMALNLWRCLGAIGLEEIDIVIARKLVARLTPDLKDLYADRVRPLVTAIATSVATIAAAPTSLERFFHFLRNKGHLWEDRLVVPLVDTQLRGSSEDIDENWNNLRQNFGKSLTAVANLETPTGRALARTLGQRLCPDWDSGAETSVEALRSLLDRIDLRSGPRGSTGEIEVQRSRRTAGELRELALAAAGG